LRVWKLQGKNLEIVISSRERKGGDINIRRAKEINNYGDFAGASELLAVCVCDEEN